VNVGQLQEALPKGGNVSPAILAKLDLAQVYKGKNPVVKILGTGEVTSKFVISDCIISQSAKEKIEKAGGTIK